jgi:hypothetical protein
MAKGKAADMVNGTIRIGGLILDDRFRIGGAEWLETKSGKSFIEFLDSLADDKPRFTDLRLCLTALAVQRNPEMDEADIVGQLRKTELNEISKAVSQLKFAEYEAKNFQQPETTATAKNTGQ